MIKASLINETLTKLDSHFSGHSDSILAISSFITIIITLIYVSLVYWTTSQVIKQTKLMEHQFAERKKEIEKPSRTYRYNKIIYPVLHIIKNEKDNLEKILSKSYNNFKLDSLYSVKKINLFTNDTQYKSLIIEFPDLENLVNNYVSCCDQIEKSIEELNKVTHDSDINSLTIKDLYEKYSEEKIIIEKLNSLTNNQTQKILEKSSFLLKELEKIEDIYRCEYKIMKQEEPLESAFVGGK